MSRKTKLIVLLLFSFSSYCFAQESIRPNSNFIEPEFMIGKVIPASTNFVFPSTGTQKTIALNLGFTNNDTTSWARYYNYAETGVMFLYSNLGNNQVLGHQYGVLPYISFSVLNKLKNPFRVKLGAGISYFTTQFDSLGNPQNEIIGQQFTWDVKVFIYKSIYKNGGFNLKLGVGFSHESNGHTKLPNLGVNSPMASITAQFYKQKEDNYFQSNRKKRQNVSPKKYFLSYEQGLGFHDQDETEGPEMGNLKPVYTSDLSGAILFNKHLKLRAGFTYRYYKTYYDHLIDNTIETLSENPRQSASNISFYMGNEFLMGHLSIDVLLGINLYKPFYNTINSGTGIGITLQKRLLTRIGANFYLINTHKLPKHNVFLGAHIKANMAKADYTDLSIGYTYKLNQ
jgi:hypothetical protein